jgi:hypothetical protein
MSFRHSLLHTVSDIMSHSAFIIFYLLSFRHYLLFDVCPRRRLLLSAFCPSVIIYYAMFCPIRRLLLSIFCPFVNIYDSMFCPFDFFFTIRCLSVDLLFYSTFCLSIFYHRRFLLRHFVGESKQHVLFND